MNYKPNESTLMAYLYGELDATESAKVREYLSQHPEEFEKLQQMTQVREMMSNILDKEVIAPSIIAESRQVHFWQSGYFKTWMSIAASFVLILIAGRVLGPDISYSNGELRISFKEAKATSTTQTLNGLLSANEVQGMIDSSLAKNNEFIQANLNESQKKVEQSLQTNLASNSAKIDALMKVASQASQDQIKGFVAALQEENLKTMKDYLQLSAKDQNVYVEALLVDFSKYLQEQRKQDFQLFQTRMANIERNTDQFKQETEQILASIISNPEPGIKKVSNY
jgi:hypothetical protein